MRLLDKYKPETKEEIVGQKSSMLKILDFINNFKPGKALLIYGSTGTGKTLIPQIIAKEQNKQLLEINASDTRTADYIKTVVKPAIQSISFFNKGKIILIDEIDNMTSKDKGGIEEIIKLIKESKYPIILTANDAYNPKLRNLRNYCELLQIKKINSLSIEKKLKEIAKKENILIKDSIIKEISRKSNGDLRSAINDLETISITGKIIIENDLDNRERKDNIFNVLKALYQNKNIKDNMEAIRKSDKKLEDIFWWIEENITNEFKDNKEIAKAFEILSQADIFYQYIRKTRNYRFYYYIANLLSSISLVRDMDNKKFVSYKPPQRLIILGKTKSQRQELDNLCQNIGKKLHCSKSKIMQQLPYLRVIMNKNI
ncbi:MAG: replication factor C large subunit [Candidatus Aenigmarchaeota archaeon]|nr:replication factor C large subunit [Candidatus Aenigmarchaeota archaeon]